MLSHHLQSAINDLKDLITITESDIADIKEAKNEPQFQRHSLKEEKIKSFEAKKAMIDYEISSKMSKNPTKELKDLLDENEHLALEELKNQLSKLRDVNKHYARLVLAVSNLYNTFLERVIPTEMQGYEKVAAKNPKILEVRV